MSEQEKIEVVSEVSTSDLLGEYQQQNLFKDVLFNDLLGDFDEKGKYIVNEDIMQDLIDMPKKIDFIDDQGIHARGFLEDRVYQFLITKPVKEENGNAYCFLRLTESISRLAGFTAEKRDVVIATYDYRFDEFYDDNVRQVFCLKEYESDDTGEEGRAYQPEYIKARYEMLYVMREVSEEHYERLEEIFFNHRIALLGMDPELIAVLAEFNKKRAKLDTYFILSRRRFYFLNQLLDEVLRIQNNQEKLKKSQIAERMKELEKKYIQKSKEIKQKMLEHPKLQPFMQKKTKVIENKSSPKKAVKPVQKGVKKGDAGKSKGGKKKGGKDKSGGGGKGGKPKKKDKPKGGGGGAKKDTDGFSWTSGIMFETVLQTVPKQESQQTEEKDTADSKSANRADSMIM